MVDVDTAVHRVCEEFTIRSLNAHQREPVEHFEEKKTDIFINLPTGFGKSLVCQALSLIFDTMLGTSGHTVVVSPLVNLMKDQVDKVSKLGIPAVSLSDVDKENVNGVEKRIFTIVYGSPEA